MGRSLLLRGLDGGGDVLYVIVVIVDQVDLRVLAHARGASLLLRCYRAGTLADAKPVFCVDFPWTVCIDNILTGAGIKSWVIEGVY